jgi:putative heme-binding domain-containing protein
VDLQSWRDILAQAKLVAGPFVRAGDRFESLAPGYAAVQAQKASPPIAIAVHSAQWTPDGRTLILATDPLSRDVHYALTLPSTAADSAEATAAHNGLPQHPSIDLDFDLSGCEAVWTSKDKSKTWQGWLPHYDLEVSKQFTAGSAPHDALWTHLEEPGELTLRGRINLNDMLRPAVQPGSKLDYEYPPEVVTLSFVAKSPETKLRLFAPEDNSQIPQDGSRASLTLPSDANKVLPIELQLTSERDAPQISVEWTTNEDSRPRPLPLRRLLLPWADTSGKDTIAALPAPAPELKGGSWARGYREFFGDQALCGKCHTICGRGGNIGPDLSNLVHRDYASVLRDIVHPNYAINPDYLSFVVATTDGRVLIGVVHTSEGKLSIGDTQGNIVELDKSQVDEMQPASISTMPEGIAPILGADRLRDLMTFLLTPPPQMPRDLADQPKPRSLAEVNAVLAGAPQLPAAIRPIRILLVAGPKDHGQGEHDYPTWQRAWTELLGAADGVEVSTAWQWPTSEQFQLADAVVVYQHGDWNPDRARDIDSFLERGGGLVYIHWAVDGRAFGRELAERIGLAAGAPIAFRHGDLKLAFHRETNHPIIRNFDSLTLVDESYWKLTGALPSARILATAIEDGQPQPQLWTVEPRNGRVFVSIPGHYSWTFDDPLFRLLLLRGIAWVAREPVDRFNDLVWPGANLAK